ncbi:hypothetical protein GTY65_25005 [Streptomyces sp. SID8379]|nr:hypothetical protein [Streptomyces sp. SID8379]
MVGWIVPTTVNLALLVVFLLPSLQGLPLIARLAELAQGRAAVAFLVGALLLGLVSSALQTPLYRILTGYLLWPGSLYESRVRWHSERRGILDDRLQRLRLEARAARRPLPPAAAADMSRLRDERRVARHFARDSRRSSPRRALLQEHLDRYPRDPRQISPTSLGNAIRRLEVEPYERFRIDLTALWDELTAVAPEQAVRQVDTARTSVNFFVCMLYGHVGVILCAAVAAASPGKDLLVVVTTAVSLCVLLPVWYRCAVTSTDAWHCAVRSLVNVGRKPLAAALHLTLPSRLADEREMWDLVCHLSRSAYEGGPSPLDRFRSTVDPPSGSGG